MPDQTDRFRRTTPWHDSEMLRVDDLLLVYDLRRDGTEMQVHLHGRRTATLPQLRATGAKVVFPDRFRYVDED